MHGAPKPKISELDFNDKFSGGYPSRNLGIQKNGLNGVNNFAAITNDTNAASKVLFQYQRGETKEDGYSSTHEESSTSVLGKQTQKKKSPSSARVPLTTMKLLRNRGTRSNPNIYGLEETLKMYRMSYSALCICEGKLRVWIKQTILKPLLEKIDQANKELAKDYPGLHLKIGESSLETFNCLAATKPEIFKNSTLTYILPFLKVCQDQEYLMQRIKELTADHSLKSYLWKAIEKTSPGEVLRLLVNNKSTASQEDTKNKENTFSPPKTTNDTEILLHMFLTYMDHVLTSNPFAAYKDVEMPFTAIYFLRTPDEPSIIHRAHSSFYLHLDKKNPIHMRLVINGGEEIMDLGVDQNNFFRTIVLFVQHCYLYNNKMVDRISLNDKSLNWKNIIM
uniref:Rho-GAP domain-containing protein n=1 Tax=Strongyloides papillosus TaxID=174720 RepID=A0A0N5B9E3_STREA